MLFYIYTFGPKKYIKHGQLLVLFPGYIRLEILCIYIGKQMKSCKSGNRHERLKSIPLFLWDLLDAWKVYYTS